MDENQILTFLRFFKRWITKNADTYYDWTIGDLVVEFDRLHDWLEENDDKNYIDYFKEQHGYKE